MIENSEAAARTALVARLPLGAARSHLENAGRGNFLGAYRPPGGFEARGDALWLVWDAGPSGGYALALDVIRRPIGWRRARKDALQDRVEWEWRGYA